jgi:outer membrane protein OmpA-like peptidoglycan-associated protein
MPRRLVSRSALTLLTSALVIPWVSGCATKSYVRDRVAELGSTEQTEHQGLRSDISRTGARAEAANTAASRAHDLALGDVQYHATGSYEVRFAFDSADLSPAGKQVLDQAVTALQGNPRYFADIVGNADTVGPDTYNDQLSQRRANAVLHYLVQHGPGPVARYAIAGWGESEPVMVAGAEDHSASRRVAVSILEAVEPGSVPADEPPPTTISSADIEPTPAHATRHKKVNTDIQRADANGQPR